ncbi:MAG TPA: BatD family protein [Paludibacteraceae bacterium]|nr:BatD family protein [Paludibacteraceae bacterium]
MKRKIFLLFLIFSSFIGVKADEPVRFTATAPSTVILDKPFQLVYTINAQGKDLRVPEIKDFDILAGPFESRSSSIQIVNGKRSSSMSISYTYTLMPQRTGTFTIPSASIMVNSQKYTSNGLTIKVLPADQQSDESSSPADNGRKPSSKNISNENIFIRTIPSKTNVYEQEAILITYKLYTLVDVAQCVNKKMPDFDGFLKQEIEQTQNKQFSYENYNGHNYGTVVLYQTLLYPQRAGTIQIGNAVFESVIRVQNQTSIHSIFDDFFDSYTNVTKNLVAPGLKITVKPLPEDKPMVFGGAVGNFTMSSSISAQEVKENEAVTLKINIAGSGNMKLIKTPEVKFPSDFEIYDPKVTNNFKTSASGVSGTKTIEYLFIPRHSGNFEIPPVEFSYFDLRDKTYKMLRTPSYSLKVLKGSGNQNTTVVSNYNPKEDIRQINKDIRYIYTGNIRLIKTSTPIFGSTLAWLLFIIPLLVAAGLFFFFRKKVKENADIALVRNKKANKMAQRRLKLAQKLLKEGNKDAFYDEILKATWNYLSNKLSIPVASLTRETVLEELSVRGVPDELTKQLMKILNDCEFARYAPKSGQQEMGNMYEETMQVISGLEEAIKK